jgi:hypothetical protein
MYEHGSLPRARQDDLLLETVGEELLLYDQNSHTAHCLRPIAACVWRHCNGKRDVTELAELAGASEDLVADALQELREKNLLDAEPALVQRTVSGVSRREAIGRIARVGAAAAAGSMIVSATAATPAMASSGGGFVGFAFSPSALTWASKESTSKKLEIKLLPGSDPVKLLSQKTTDETDFETKDPNGCFGKSLVSPCSVEIRRKTTTVTGLKFWEFSYEDEASKVTFNEPNAVDLEGK